MFLPPVSATKLLDESDGLFRRPQQNRGIAKFESMLDAAEQLIVEAPEKALSLYDIAERSGVAVGSVYHFFPSAQAVSVALIERYDNKFAELAEQINQDFESWQEVVKHHVELSFHYLKQTPAAQHLLLGAAQNWVTRKADLRGDWNIAQSMAAAVESRFQVPEGVKAVDLLFYAIRLLEAMWGTSLQLHGEMKKEALEQSLLAMESYILNYWPDKLEPRP